MTAFKVGDKARVNYSKFMHLGFGPHYHSKIGTVVEISSASVVKLAFADAPERRCSIYYLERLQLNAGDRVRCKQLIMFYDGEQHNAGDEFIVNEQTLSYYQWAFERGDYELLPPLPQYFALVVKHIPGGGRVSFRWHSNNLAECITYAQMKVEEDGYHTATVHEGEQIRSLFIAVRDFTGKVICIKSAECNATTIEIADALRKYVRGELGE